MVCKRRHAHIISVVEFTSMLTTTCGNRVTSKRTVMFTSKEVVAFTGDKYDHVHIIIRGN